MQLIKRKQLRVTKSATAVSDMEEIKSATPGNFDSGGVSHSTVGRAVAMTAPGPMQSRRHETAMVGIGSIDVMIYTLDFIASGHLLIFQFGPIWPAATRQHSICRSS